MNKQLNYLVYKNICSLDYNLYISEKGTYKGASRDISYESIPGRRGDLIIDNGRYKNITIPYQMTLVTNEYRDFTTLANLIKTWLLTDVGYFELWDTYDKSYYRAASYSSEINIEQELRDVGKINLSFNCKPFKYSLDGQKIIVLENPGYVYNAEFFSSLPYIKIVGNGNITLTVNESSFYFENVEDYIEIDSEIKNAFKENISQNNKMKTYNFPSLSRGKNTISWVGSVQKIEIIPRWCCL